mmetsp:Transcript_65150/g.115781  ORF Transcript_65150/g.115781 Transcript_65150/m.115781 type:complete len:224 (-) Transcript_65150:1651-2322(-)
MGVSATVESSGTGPRFNGAPSGTTGCVIGCAINGKPACFTGTTEGSTYPGGQGGATPEPGGSTSGIVGPSGSVSGTIWVCALAAAMSAFDTQGPGFSAAIESAAETPAAVAVFSSVSPMAFEWSTPDCPAVLAALSVDKGGTKDSDFVEATATPAALASTESKSVDVEPLPPRPPPPPPALEPASSLPMAFLVACAAASPAAAATCIGWSLAFFACKASKAPA